MSASTYINIEITYQSDKDKFYFDYIYNNIIYHTETAYEIFSAIDYLMDNLNMNFDEANSLINEVINNS